MAGNEPLSLEIRLGDAEGRLRDDLAQSQSELAARPDDGRLWLRKGDLLARLGRDAEAREALVAATEAGGSLDSSIELAACEMRLGRWTSALEILDRALARSSKPEARLATLYNRAAWYLNLAPPEMRDAQKALDYARHAIELEPGNVEYLSALGLALYRLNELAVATQTLKLSLRTSTMPIFDLAGLALCYRAAGDFSRAADFASRADYVFEVQAPFWAPQQAAEVRRLREEVSLAFEERQK
jgi:tetratricopeptide (TPR) repeat protein